MGNDSDNKDVSLTAITAAEDPFSSQYLGLLLKDRYLIEREIGRGGIGLVYLARDRQLLSRPVVIKVLFARSLDQSSIEWFHKKFRQEMEALVRINHPGVVGVLDSGEMPDGKPFLVMQYVEGITLRSVMTKEGMDFDRTARIVRQIGHALTAAHGKGVCHRDLKPENVMLEALGGGEEQVKLIDFGIARVNDSQVGTSAEQTWVAGTPAYMSPEQLRGRPTVESDIYSFGALAYEMLTGQIPFNAETTVGLYELQQKSELIPPKRLRRDLPEAAQAAILKALSFNAQNRHSSALAFGEELARALTAAPASFPGEAAPGDDLATIALPQPPKKTAPYRARDAGPAPAPRRPTKSLIAAALLIAVTALSLFLLRDRFASKDQPAQPSPTPILPERSLEYWIMVQKYRNQKPFGTPFRLPGTIMFDAGDRVVLHLSVSAPGYFYLLNEGPQAAGGLPEYVFLFPRPTDNGGSAQVPAGQELHFPQSGRGFELDKERGTEKLWLVWSTESVAQLEAVKSVVNEKQLGAITDPAQIRSVRDYLAQSQTESHTTALQDKVKSRTFVTARGAALVHQIELLHY